MATRRQIMWFGGRLIVTLSFGGCAGESVQKAPTAQPANQPSLTPTVVITEETETRLAKILARSSLLNPNFQNNPPD